MEKTLTKHRIGGGAALLIFAGIVIAVNVILAGVRWRADLTEDHLYTLSEGTRSLLSGMERDVTLKLYVSKSDSRVPIQLKQFALRLEELLREYETHSGGRVVLETYDPKPDSDEQEWAQKYGVSGQATGMMGTGPTLYLGLVALSGARESVIPAISPNQEPQLEYLLTRLIHEVSLARKPKIGVLSSLPVMGTPAAPYGGDQGTPAWLFATELRRTYELEEVAMDATAIPDDIDTLILMQPKDPSDTLLFAIDQFVLRGGRVLALLDPLCVAGVELSGQPLFQQRGGIEGMNKLLGAWGLNVDAANVVADVKHATNLRSTQGAATRNVAWLSLRSDSIKEDEVATTGLDNLLLVHAGHFSGEPTEGLTLTALLQSSDRSGTVATMQSGMAQDGGYASMTPQGKALRLAVRLQGRFKTAFPDGRPASGETDESKEEAEEKKPALTESSEESAVILIADADLIYDRFCVRARNFFGQTMHEPLNDNLSFVLNMTEQLTGSEALIGLRSRGTFNRPFTRVLELEREAQERWRQEEQELQQELQEAQNRLNELQQQKDPNQQFIVSPQQQAEVAKFRQKQFETQKALKDVRKKLRSDVERLGMTIKTINMVSMPLLVGIFGIFMGLRRRKL